MSTPHHHHLCEYCEKVIGSNSDPIAKDCGQTQDHARGLCVYCHQILKYSPDREAAAAMLRQQAPTWTGLEHAAKAAAAKAAVVR